MRLLNSPKRISITIASALTAAIFTSGLQAQSDATETMLKMYSGPDEYYLFGTDRKKVVDYKTARIIRICAGTSKHLVPLEITYDNKHATIGSGDCMRVEAKEVYLEPQKALSTNWDIRAEVETMN